MTVDHPDVRDLPAPMQEMMARYGVTHDMTWDAAVHVLERALDVCVACPLHTRCTVHADKFDHVCPNGPVFEILARMGRVGN